MPGLVGRERSEARPMGAPQTRTANKVSRERRGGRHAPSGAGRTNSPVQLSSTLRDSTPSCLNTKRRFGPSRASLRTE